MFRLILKINNNFSIFIKIQTYNIPTSDLCDMLDEYYGKQTASLLLKIMKERENEYFRTSNYDTFVTSIDSSLDSSSINLIRFRKLRTPFSIYIEK